MSRDGQVHPEFSRAAEELDVAVGWVLSQPFDSDLPDRITDSTSWLQQRLDALDDMTRPQEMLCENIRELSEYVETVSDELASRAAGA